MQPVAHRRVVNVDGFEANLNGLMLPMGLRVDRVRIIGSGLQFSHDPFGVKTEEGGKLEVFVSEEDLAAFLNKSSPAGLKNVTVEAKNGMLHIRATKTVLIDVKAYVVCTLRIVDGKKLFVDLESIELMGVGPKQLMQTQLDKINPVIDTEDFPVLAHLETVDVTQGGILLRGRVWPPEK